MKKVISIIALVVAMVMMMSVSSFAAATFEAVEKTTDAEGVETVYGSYADVDGVATFTTADGSTTLTSDEDSISVTTASATGNYYGILLVAGDALPTVDNAILYIDQATAADVTQAFEVLPIIPTTLVDENDEPVYNLGDPLTLYISSNVAGAELIAIPMVYDEEKAAYVIGDINNDGLWNATDALRTLQIGAGTYEASETEEAAADVNEDGLWNATDALKILQYGAGTITSWK